MPDIFKILAILRKSFFYISFPHLCVTSRLISLKIPSSRRQYSLKASFRTVYLLVVIPSGRLTVIIFRLSKRIFVIFIKHGPGRLYIRGLL